MESFRVYHRQPIKVDKIILGEKVNENGYTQGQIFFYSRSNMWHEVKILLKSFGSWHKISVVKENC